MGRPEAMETREASGREAARATSRAMLVAAGDLRREAV